MKAPDSLPPGSISFLQDPGLRQLFDLVEAAGGEVRVNGGAVRNALLDEPIGEVDLSATLRPEHVTDCLQRGGVKVVPTGIEHGTVTAIVEGGAYEITTLREDIETDGRRAVVKFGTDWTADAMRRDFTMNALYCDRHGRLFDPLGGYCDVIARRVRFIGEAEARIAEDRLRILRFFRMYAWYGRYRPDTAALRACVRMRDGLAGLSAERVWQELKRLLEAPDPYRAMLWMRTSDILSLILPESSKWGIELIPGLVTCEAEAGNAPDPILRLMAVIPPREGTITGLAERLRLSAAEMERLKSWAALSKEFGERTEAPDDGELAPIIYRNGRQPLLDILRLQCAARQGGDSRDIRKAIGFAQAWPLPEFPLKGRDLVELGHEPGPELGQLLRRLENDWIESGFGLTPARLLELAGRYRQAR